MVATRLSEVYSKGMDYAYGKGSVRSSANEDAGETTSYTSYLSGNLESAQQTFAGLVSSLYSPPDTSGDTIASEEGEDVAMPLESNNVSPYTLKLSESRWMFKNPLATVRGRHHNPQSISAVRSLLSLVPVEPAIEQLQKADAGQSEFVFDESFDDRRSAHPRSSRSETASQLAEGTIRALRDVALDEAQELHRALRFWTDRWERPLLSWLEAGPWVWMSDDGYNHQQIGQKVSQIQAVLARRVGAIGELQQHLLRAGWQKGVASWAVLGEGGQWAAVAGFDGRMSDVTMNDNSVECAEHRRPVGKRMSRRLASEMDSPPLTKPTIGIRRDASINSINLREVSHKYYGHTNILVDGMDGGRIQSDDPALAAWSVDAMRLIRGHLFRAGNGIVPLPYADNWTDEDPPSSGDVDTFVQSEGREEARLPKWAASMPRSPVKGEPTIFRSEQPSTINIVDLPLMASEVSALLNSMEPIMEAQRNRRLDQLKALPRFRRNWYVYAAGAPVLAYIMYKLLRNGYGKELLKFLVEKIQSFGHDHVWEPLQAIFEELFTRSHREKIDHEARDEVIESLKKMIRSWLDETYPEMEEVEKNHRAERMDMSLIEHRKEENMKTIYEINSVVRMSFIEMQFIKKEMMNALIAMDEMLMSNEINMNLAAVTPAVMILYTTRYFVRFLWYALLQLGKTREETYAQFRKILLDVERLLVVRDSPPSAPPPIENGDMMEFSHGDNQRTLNSDDLGMLLLHLHECRTLLWEDRRRFTPQVLRDVAEDLAELAGERGQVSVRQQLQIISRMYRTHAFMKIVSTGIPVDVVVSGKDF